LNARAFYQGFAGFANSGAGAGGFRSSSL